MHQWWIFFVYIRQTVSRCVQSTWRTTNNNRRSDEKCTATPFSILYCRRKTSKIFRCLRWAIAKKKQFKLSKFDPSLTKRTHSFVLKNVAVCVVFDGTSSYYLVTSNVQPLSLSLILRLAHRRLLRNSVYHNGYYVCSSCSAQSFVYIFHPIKHI